MRVRGVIAAQACHDFDFLQQLLDFLVALLQCHTHDQHIAFKHTQRNTRTYKRGGDFLYSKLAG